MREQQRPARRAGAADVAGLARLAAWSFRAKFGVLYPPEVLAAYVAETYSEAAVAGLLAEPGVAAWVLDGVGRSDGARRLDAYLVLGPCSLPHSAATAACVELRRLYTAPDVVGLGLGGRLMRQAAMPAFAAAKAQGGDAWVGVYSGNAGALRFYARYGFEPAGEYEFPVGPVRDREFILRRRPQAAPTMLAG